MAKKKPGIAWTIIGAFIIIGLILAIFKAIGWLVGLGLLGWAGYMFYHRRKNPEAQWKAWNPWTSIVSGLFVLLLWLGAVSSDANTATHTAEKTQSAATNQSATVATTAQPQQTAPSTGTQQQSQQSNFIQAHVVKVVDGDTMDVTYDGKQDTIRLLLIDTPETHKPDTPVEPFGPEASDFATKTLADKDVKLELDGPQRDKYNRLLCYLWVGDKLFNKMQIEKGYARVAYVYNPPYKHYDELVSAEQKAKQDKIGIWSIPGYVTDNGFNVEVAKNSSANQQSAPLSQQQVQAPQQSAQPTQQTKPTQQQAQAEQTVYYRNCAEVRAAGKAPLHRGDPGYRSGLDRDNDGIACE